MILIMSKAYFIGIDVGTQGARVVLLDELGEQFAAENAVFPLTEDSRQEQSPETWWQTCSALMVTLTRGIKNTIDLSKIKAIAVTSTSGTIVPLDQHYNPLHAAIMYSDPRSAKEATWCKDIAVEEVKEGYTAFNASSGLPKMRWFMNEYPSLVPDLHKFVHAADFITGRFCDEYNVTDYTNAMKSGYDLHQDRWPDYIHTKIGIHEKWLQKVRFSGEPVAALKAKLAAEWGLPADVMVTTGVTDGCASQIASGAMNLGQWNTTIGTTLVIKGVTKNEIKDPTGAIYNHRHPAGYWMPGGASNTGADWVSKLFAGQDLQALGAKTAEHLPSSSLVWPLFQLGERFPFVAPTAKGFWIRMHNASKDPRNGTDKPAEEHLNDDHLNNNDVVHAAIERNVQANDYVGIKAETKVNIKTDPKANVEADPGTNVEADDKEKIKGIIEEEIETYIKEGSNADNADLFAACMEGVAFIERYAYEKIMQLSGEKVDMIYSAGGGSDSDTWLKIRSAVTRIPVCKMKNVSGAAGAAILAASKTFYNSLQEAAAAMVKPEITINPDLRLADQYDKKYQSFIAELHRRQILK
jgi:sugar (pentulose or hexulose) kinase